jgi:hypothetical protein
MLPPTSGWRLWYPTTTLHGVTTQKTTWNITAVKVPELVSRKQQFVRFRSCQKGLVPFKEEKVVLYARSSSKSSLSSIMKFGNSSPQQNKRILTPWKKVFLEKLTVAQLVKKLPAFCGARRFITMFIGARQRNRALRQPELNHEN